MDNKYVSSETLKVCELWHGGQSSACYSILSLGYVYSVEYAERAASELRGALFWATARTTDEERADVDAAIVELESLAASADTRRQFDSDDGSYY